LDQQVLAADSASRAFGATGGRCQNSPGRSWARARRRCRARPACRSCRTGPVRRRQMRPATRQRALWRDRDRRARSMGSPMLRGAPAPPRPSRQRACAGSASSADWPPVLPGVEGQAMAVSAVRFPGAGKAPPSSFWRSATAGKRGDKAASLSRDSGEYVGARPQSRYPPILDPRGRKRAVPAPRSLSPLEMRPGPLGSARAPSACTIDLRRR
jgi:hypothetical protein